MVKILIKREKDRRKSDRDTKWNGTLREDRQNQRKRDKGSVCIPL
jgi:hypothetical protein